MQRLKEEIKNAIIDSAKEEFFNNGFNGASMRKIALNIGITVGNLYRYFKNKEELFYYITAPVYEMIKSFILNHNDIYDESVLNTKNFNELLDEFTGLFIISIKQYKIEILILANGAEGTDYANAKNDFIGFLADHAMTHFVKYYPDEDICVLKILAKAFSSSFIEGILEIIRKNDDELIFKNVLEKYLDIVFKGYLPLI